MFSGRAAKFEYIFGFILHKFLIINSTKWPFLVQESVLVTGNSIVFFKSLLFSYWDTANVVLGVFF